MTDKELNKAILDELYKIADDVWNLMYKCSIVGTFTAREIANHLGKDMFWGENDANKLNHVEVDTFRCSFLTAQVFDVIAKFELLAGVGSKRHLFVAEMSGKVESLVTFAVTKDLEDLCYFCDTKKLNPTCSFIIIDAENKCLVAGHGRRLKVCPVTFYKKKGDTSGMRILATDFKKMCAKMKGKKVYRMTATKERTTYDTCTNIMFEGIAASSKHEFRLLDWRFVPLNRSSELCFDVLDWKAVNKLAKTNPDENIIISGKRGEKIIKFKVGNCDLQVKLDQELYHSFCVYFANDQFVAAKKAESMRLFLGTTKDSYIEAVDNNGNVYVFMTRAKVEQAFVGEYVDGTLVAPKVERDIDIFDRYILNAKRTAKTSKYFPSNKKQSNTAIAKRACKQAKHNPVDNSRKFTFAAVDVHPGDKLTFVDGKEVVAVDENKVSFEGNTYTLSGFCKAFMPAEKRNKSNSYRGCAFFYRNGVKLEKLFNNALQGKEQPADGVAVTATPLVEAHAEKVEPNVTEPIVTECAESSHVEKPRYVFAASLRMLRPLNYTLRHSPRHGAHGRNGVRKITPALCSWLKRKYVHTFSLPPPLSTLPIRS